MMVTNIFGQTCETGQILLKTVFFLKLNQLQLNYAFPVFWSIFAEIAWKLHLWVKKVVSQKDAKITQKVIFSQLVWKGKNPEENLDTMETNFFVKAVTGQILPKTVFILKICHIQLNQDFLVFWSNFAEIDRNFSFGSKSDYLQNKPRITQKVIFLNMFEKRQIQRNILIWWK